MRGVGGIDARDPCEGTSIVNVSFTREVAKASERNETSLRVESYEVRERGAEVVE